MTFEIFKLNQHPKVQTKRPQSVIGILDEKPEDDNYQNYDIDFWYRKTKSVVVTTIEIFQTILLYVFTAIIGEQQYSPKSVLHQQKEKKYRENKDDFAITPRQN